jgi:hypothetical protein
MDVPLRNEKEREREGENALVKANHFYSVYLFKFSYLSETLSQIYSERMFFYHLPKHPLYQPCWHTQSTIIITLTKIEKFIEQ